MSAQRKTTRDANAWAALQKRDRAFLARLARLAREAGPARVALVGGAVRDALLGLTPLDLDVVVEGISVQDLAQRTGLAFTYHPRYDNATLQLPDGRALDLIHARSETYPTPGGPPSVRPADLLADLARRDFALNAIALVVSDDEHAELLDPHGGREDLTRRTLRPLTPHSFRDDASRIVRGARLAARLGLTLHADGLAQVPDARAHAPHTHRVRHEFPLVLSEPRPGRVLATLRNWGAPDILGSDASDALERLDALAEAGHDVPHVAYTAAWLGLQPDPAEAAHAYGAGDKALRLLERARGDEPAAERTPEHDVRYALRIPEPPHGLTGRDVLALGVSAGPAVGRALRYLADLRHAGLVRTREDEHEALAAYLQERTS